MMFFALITLFLIIAFYAVITMLAFKIVATLAYLFWFIAVIVLIVMFLL